MTTQPFAAAPTLALDHLTILSRSVEAAAEFYGVVLPQLGFSKVKTGIWHNAAGLHFQFRSAAEATREYERYGPGLNHFGFKAPSLAFVENLHKVIVSAGYEARLQSFPDGTLALFIPDPDGLRIEVSWYPNRSYSPAVV